MPDHMPACADAEKGDRGLRIQADAAAAAEPVGVSAASSRQARPTPSAATPSASSPASPRPLRLVLLAVIWLPLLLLAVGAGVSWRVTWDHAEAELLHTADAAAELARRVLDSQKVMVDRIDDLLRGLTDAEIRDREAELHTELQAMVATLPQLVTGYVLDRNGVPLVSANVFPVPHDMRFTDRDFFAGLRGAAASPLFVGQVYQRRTEGALLSAVAQRRRHTGNPHPADGFDGVTTVSVDPRAIGEGLGRLPASPKDAVAMIRTDGEILARFPLLDRPPPPLPPDSVILESMRMGAERGTGLQRSPVDGRLRLVAFRRIEGWPVFTFAGRDRSAIIAGWAWSVALLAAIGLPVMLALVALVRLAEERARQETIARTAQAEDTVRRNAAAALRASEARYRTLSEVAADVVWSRLETGSMPAPQPSWESFTAQTPSQYRGFGWQDAVHPADREAAAQLWDEATAAGTAYETELRLRHRDGTWRHCLVRAAPVPLADGEPGPALWVGAHIDVTPLREAEERQRFLMQEIDHRAKNVLSVVQAAMRLTRAASPEAFVAAVEGRVAALARAQTVLAEGRWTGADLRRLLEGEFARLPRRRRDPHRAGRAERAAAVDNSGRRPAALDDGA